MSKAKIFIGSSMNGIAVAHAIESLLKENFKVIQWTGAPFNHSKPLVHSLRAIANEVDLAIFVFPYRDIHNHYFKEEQLRSNLLFELGLFVGLLGIDRIFLIKPKYESFEFPSHFEGLSTFFHDIRNNKDLPSAIAPAVSIIHRMVSGLSLPMEKKEEYFSCFISYSSHDQHFVKKLYEDLRNVGVRCWLDEKNLRIGDSLAGQISRAIAIHDKVLLILSEASVKSAWVKKEIRNVFSLERTENRLFLFPIRIDDAVFSSQRDDAFDLIRSRHIGDFRNWQGQGAYRKSFSRLVRDLAISTSVEAGSENHA
ncbi:MAG: TIR domain-containing protein [Gammaproteobacteria bacterium]|jgi:hypothetical protein|nr:TIR domain-containing protein [Gammaproteobacteria bacterium]